MTEQRCTWELNPWKSTAPMGERGVSRSEKYQCSVTVNSSHTATRLGDTSFSTERDPEDPSYEGTGAARTVLVAVGSTAAGLLVFGTLYERTRGLAVPIVAHAVYNTLLLVLAFLAL